MLEPSSICTASCSPIDLHIGPGSRGVHAPWGHDAFSPCFRFPPIFKKFQTLWKFFKMLPFPENFFHFPPVSRKLLFPLLWKISPLFSINSPAFYILYVDFVSPLLWPWCIIHHPRHVLDAPACLDLRVLYVDRVFAWHKIYLYNMTSESITLSSEISKIPIEMKLKAHMYRRDSQRISNKTEFRELGTSANQQWRPQRATCT